MRKLAAQIPNLITSLNLISGSAAVIFAIDGHLTLAGIFICLAAVFDFLDGLAARTLQAYSEIGKQLDSLADLISFGLAPAAILFTLLELSLFGKNMPVHQITAGWVQWLILFSATLMPVFGAVRLALFNTRPTGHFFRGLPIPANGIFWASMGLILEVSPFPGNSQMIYSTGNLFFMGLFTSVMMVISLPMFSLKFTDLRLKENWYRYIFLFIAIILIVVLKVHGIALTILTYIALNFLFYLFKVKY
ncbi:MAG: CDP-alcohol phosphatidyltransferase family protein [Prolixibacteraceae bacterium]|nr:CDP-alcohol phosphatidyltransferase family protein [Prolixibacteraceae bacterium]